MEIYGLSYLNFEINLFALVTIKEFIKELITRVNKEINAQKYPKVIVEIDNTSVSILIKEI